MRGWMIDWLGSFCFRLMIPLFILRRYTPLYVEARPDCSSFVFFCIYIVIIVSYTQLTFLVRTLQSRMCVFCAYTIWCMIKVTVTLCLERQGKKGYKRIHSKFRVIVIVHFYADQLHPSMQIFFPVTQKRPTNDRLPAQIVFPSHELRRLKNVI